MSEPRGGLRLLRRALIVGASFGAMAVLFELMLLIVGKLKVGVAMPGWAMVSSVGLEIAVGLALGLLFAPLLRLKKGGSEAHVFAIAVGWVGLGLFAGLPDLTLFRVLVVVPWLVTPLLVIGGIHVARRSPLSPFVAGAAVLFGLMVIPEVYAWWHAPPEEPVPEVQAPEGAPDVVLVVLDTVRADHVGAYGYELATTPSLDALAREGARFEHATAPATWSLPSHASLFTGRYVSGHQAHGEHRVLNGDAVTLAEALRDSGYDTRCFTANAWITDALGLTRGFLWSDEAWRSGETQLTRLYGFRLLDRLGFGADDNGGAQVVANFEDWADSTPADARPTFAFVNLIEAHFPYHQVPSDYLARFTDQDRSELRDVSLSLMEAQFGGEPPGPEAVGPASAMYDAGVLYVDHLLGRLVEAVRRRGTLDRTVFVVLSDHGELLREHGGAFGHGHSVYEIETNVPLVVRYPERVEAGTTVRPPVSTTGVMATILDLAGVGIPETVQAGSLLPAIEGGAPGSPVISERYGGSEATARADSVQRDPLMRSDLRYRAYRSGQTKLVMASNGTFWLFELSEDPLERHDLSAERPEEVARLLGELSQWTTRLHLPAIGDPLDLGEEPQLDPAARERLRELGYIE